VASYVAALLIAAGLNFGYEFHPQYLLGSFPVAAAGVAFIAVALALVRVGSARVRLVLGFAALVGCFATVILQTEFAGFGRGETERRNAPLLSQIASFPGGRAGVIQTRPTRPNTDSFAKGYLNQNDGWTSSRVDQLPADTSANEAMAHYLDQLRRRGWRVRTFGHDLLGRRDRALLEVYIRQNPSNVTVRADFEGNRLCNSPAESGCW
jgi:hypothetical protein